MSRLLLDAGGLVSCLSFIAACYLWMGGAAPLA